MSFDKELFSSKIKKYRNQFNESIEKLSEETGIDNDKLKALDGGKAEPTGDEVLILADHFLVDYNFFITNERITPIEQTEGLFRKHGDELTTSDRWAIQKFLYLCECEEFLMRELSYKRRKFSFTPEGGIYKKHGEEAAKELRKFLGYGWNNGIKDIYYDFRNIGLHIFRRKLENSDISGLYIKHPFAGDCIIVNYDEDVYRQRFSAAHEVAHSIFDKDSCEPIISYKFGSDSYKKMKQNAPKLNNSKFSKEELIEIRANNFASKFLMPGELLKSISKNISWDAQKGKEWANKLKVSTMALAFALRKIRLIDDNKVQILKNNPVVKENKEDPELSGNLSPNTRTRILQALKRGLSKFYIDLCFDAYDRGTISIGKLSEMLLQDMAGIYEFADLFGKKLHYEHTV